MRKESVKLHDKSMSGGNDIMCFSAGVSVNQSYHKITHQRNTQDAAAKIFESAKLLLLFQSP